MPWLGLQRKRGCYGSCESRKLVTKRGRRFVAGIDLGSPTGGLSRRSAGMARAKFATRPILCRPPRPSADACPWWCLPRCRSRPEH